VRLPPGAVLLGLVLAAPTLWAALVAGTVPVDVALQRVLLALVLSIAGGLALENQLRAYARPETEQENRGSDHETLHRRRSDDAGATAGQRPGADDAPQP
jgi:hypothetical protein